MASAFEFGSGSMSNDPFMGMPVLVRQDACDPFRVEPVTPSPSAIDRQFTFALSPSMGVAAYGCSVPADLWMVRGLFCTGAWEQTNSATVKGVSLTRLLRENKFDEDGTQFRVSLKKSYYPFNLSMDDADALAKKLPYLLRSIRASNNGGGATASQICAVARNSYSHDNRVLNGQPNGPTNSPTAESTGNSFGLVAHTPASYSCQLPKDCWSIKNLFCACPVTTYREWNGTSVTNSLHLMKLTTDECFYNGGSHFEVHVNKPKHYFRLSLDEAQDLSVKLPYMIHSVRLASMSPSLTPTDMCNMARANYEQDVTSQNVRPADVSPIGQSFSQSTAMSGGSLFEPETSVVNSSSQRSSLSSNGSGSPEPKRQAIRAPTVGEMFDTSKYSGQ